MEPELECLPALGLAQRGAQPCSGPAARDSPGGGPTFFTRSQVILRIKQVGNTGLGIQVRPTSVKLFFLTQFLLFWPRYLTEAKS